MFLPAHSSPTFMLSKPWQTSPPCATAITMFTSHYKRIIAVALPTCSGCRDMIALADCKLICCCICEPAVHVVCFCKYANFIALALAAKRIPLVFVKFCDLHHNRTCNVWWFFAVPFLLFQGEQVGYINWAAFLMQPLKVSCCLLWEGLGGIATGSSSSDAMSWQTQQSTKTSN